MHEIPPTPDARRHLVVDGTIFDTAEQQVANLAVGERRDIVEAGIAMGKRTAFQYAEWVLDMLEGDERSVPPTEPGSETVGRDFSHGLRNGFSGISAALNLMGIKLDLPENPREMDHLFENTALSYALMSAQKFKELMDKHEPVEKIRDEMKIPKSVDMNAFLEKVGKLPSGVIEQQLFNQRP